MIKFTKYCSEEQTKKAYELGAPIEKGNELTRSFNINNPYYKEISMFGTTLYFIPTVEQMVGWLRSLGFQFYVTDAINSCNVDVWHHELTGRDDDRNGDNDDFIGAVVCKKGYDDCIISAIDMSLDFIKSKK